MITPVSTTRDVPKHQESSRGPKFHHREWQTDTCSTVGVAEQGDGRCESADRAYALEAVRLLAAVCGNTKACQGSPANDS
jgi:hypothetical protein